MLVVQWRAAAKARTKNGAPKQNWTGVASSHVSAVRRESPGRSSPPSHAPAAPGHAAGSIGTIIDR